MLVGIEAINAYVGTAYVGVNELFERRGLSRPRFDNLMMAQRSVALPCEDPVTNGTNAAKPFRLQDDAARGLTICRADVLTDAVEADAERLLGVADASAVLRGTARQPELTLEVTVNDRTDIQRLLHSLQAETAARLVSAMETPLKHLAVQVDVTTSRPTADRITV